MVDRDVKKKRSELKGKREKRAECSEAGGGQRRGFIR